MDETRKALGSWISGPRAAAEEAGADFGYRGERLRLPEDGPGSLARPGRRIGALVIDWILCQLIAGALITHGGNPQVQGWWAMAVFGLMSLLLLGTAGYTPGKRLLGLKVVRLGGTRATLGQVFLRTVLLLLVIPAVVWDRDGRGLHDKAVGTVEVRT